MKRLGILLLILFPLLAKAQLDSAARWRLDIAQGSFHNGYPYPITDLRFIRPVPAKRWQADARLRSYGIMSIFSHRAYDLDLLLQYNWFQSPSRLIYAGAGPRAELRLVQDSRSTAQSGVEFVVTAGLSQKLGRFTADIPLRTVFYANGFSAAVWPEISYRCFKRSELFLRFENNWLIYYSGISHEWFYNSFVGIKIKR